MHERTTVRTLANSCYQHLSTTDEHSILRVQFVRDATNSPWYTQPWLYREYKESKSIFHRFSSPSHKYIFTLRPCVGELLWIACIFAHFAPHLIDFLGRENLSLLWKSDELIDFSKSSAASRLFPFDPRQYCPLTVLYLCASVVNLEPP